MKACRFIKFFVCVLFAFTVCFNMTACLGVDRDSLKITFDACGGTPEIQTFYCDNIRVIEPTKEGYIFDGWYWDEGAWNEPFDANAILGKTVYAKWLSITIGENGLPRLNIPYNFNFKEGFMLTWRMLPDAIGYSVEVGGKTFETQSVIPSFDLNWLIEGKEYQVRVRSNGDDVFFADSVWSEAISIIGQAPSNYSTNSFNHTLINNDSYSISRGNSLGSRVILPEYHYNLPIVKIENFSSRPLKTIALPSTLEIIGRRAFYRTQLVNIEIPDSVTTIESEAFSGCSSLTTVVIGENVSSIADDAFEFCTGLANIIVAPQNPYYKSEGNCLIRKIDNTVMLGSITSVISDGVETIAARAFAGLPIENLIIPASVTSIGVDAFLDCRHLKIYAEAKSRPSGWSEDWNSAFCPVMWNYKGEQFEDAVFEDFYDRDYERVNYDIANASCREILVDFFNLYLLDEIGVNTLTYASIIAFGKLAFSNYNAYSAGIYFDGIINIGRGRGGYGISVINPEISPKEVDVISLYWGFIKPIISEKLRSSDFSYRLYYNDYYSVDFLDVHMDALLSGAENGKLKVDDCHSYIHAVFAASYGKIYHNGPKLSTEFSGTFYQNEYEFSCIGKSVL